MISSLAICIPCRMPASTDGTRIYCIYCGFSKETFVQPPPPKPVRVPEWHAQDSRGGSYTYYFGGSQPVMHNSVMVFKNGLLQKEHQDYTTGDGYITFSGCTTQSDNISIRYVQEGYRWS